MPKILLILMTPLFIVFFLPAAAWAHCEIPCGIYDDHLRIHLISEHTQTIEKSMAEIMKLSGQNPVNYNQLTRWISNKEKHAKKIQRIVTQYFMTQRIKLNAKQYAQKLTLLHQMLVSAMKCKQTTDLGHVQKLRSLLKEFEALYFGQSDQ